MTKTVFADRLGNLTISNGVARLDFLTLKEFHKDTNQADFEVAFKLMIPADGLMQTIETLEKVKADMVAHAEATPSQPATVAKEKVKSKEKPATPKTKRRKLTRAEFEQLPKEQQEKIRQRAKRREQERLRRQLEQ